VRVIGPSPEMAGQVLACAPNSPKSAGGARRLFNQAPRRTPKSGDSGARLALPGLRHTDRSHEAPNHVWNYNSSGRRWPLAGIASNERIRQLLLGDAGRCREERKP
jgi:hypothetical protein